MPKPKHLKKSSRFPNLQKTSHEVTSDADASYNCVSYAYGITNRKLWPGFTPDYFWPRNFPQTETVETLKKLFETVGYSDAENGTFIEGFEKVAIYADSKGKPTHAARQIGHGKWSSKLGNWFDIEHTENGVSGGDYGKIVAFMVRKKSVG
jgi:hypothetical protein